MYKGLSAGTAATFSPTTLPCLQAFPAPVSSERKHIGKVRGSGERAYPAQAHVHTKGRGRDVLESNEKPILIQLLPYENLCEKLASEDGSTASTFIY